MLPAALLFLVLPILQVFLYLQGHSDYPTADLVNFASSITALHWLLANVIIATKFPKLQRWMPYDQRIRLHVITSMGLILAVAYHALFKIFSGKSIDPITWSLMGVLGIFFIMAFLWIPIPGFRKFHEWLASRKLKPGYEKSKRRHRGFLIAILLLLFMHVGNYLSKLSLPSLLIVLLLFLVAIGGHILGLAGAFRRKAEVVGVQVQGDIIQLQIKTNKPLHYQSGQFAFLRLKGPQGYEEHPFSFLSAPHEGDVRFAIRMLGDFTQHLREIQPGTKLTVHGGFGNFFPQENAPLCFLASGIGIVPFVSIIKEMHAQKDPRQVLFLAAVNQENEIPDKPELDRIAQEMPHVQIRYFVFSQDQKRYGTELLRTEIQNREQYHYYLCSSPRVRQVLIASLKELGVASNKIHFEEFSLG